MAKAATVKNDFVVEPTVLPIVPGEEQATSQQTKETIVLTALEACLLNYLIGKSNPHIKADEQALFDKTSFEVPAEVVESLVKKGLMESGENGQFVPTRYAFRWILSSRTFGYNFKRMFESLNVSALHRAFFTICERLYAVHEKSPIYYYEKGTKNISKFWEQMASSIDLADQCLETKPKQ